MPDQRLSAAALEKRYRIQLLEASFRQLLSLTWTLGRCSATAYQAAKFRATHWFQGFGGVAAVEKQG